MKNAVQAVRRTRTDAPFIAAAVLLMFATPATGFFHNAPDIDLGRSVYAQTCAICHGATLQGQPNWREGNPDGTYPAPPHDQTGHTWHHGDAMLLDYIRRGGQAVLDDMDVAFPSGMPALESVLTEAEIDAVLAYIKSTWPDRIRAAQDERTQTETASE